MVDRPPPSLATYGLSIGYRLPRDQLRRLASDLELRLEAGELVCLLGPNGAGKTTLLRTLAGLQPALDGTVEVAGEALATLSARQRARRLAVVLTDRQVPGMMTAEEMVRLGRYPYTSWSGRQQHSDQEAVADALCAVGAESLAIRPLGELSDGERQKVALARALAQGASVLILDEVTAFLDLPRRIEVLTTLRRLARDQQRAVLLSTHDLDLALRSADRLWLLSSAGELVAGVPEALALDGALERVFAAEGVELDFASGNYRLDRAARGDVAVHADDPQLAEAIWTRRALERLGYRPTSGSAPLLITVASTPKGIRWSMEDQQQAASASYFDTLADLIEALSAGDPTAAAQAEGPEGVIL